MDLTIALSIGKHLLLVGIYVFVLVIFRGIIRQLVAESRRERSEASGARGSRASAQSRHSRRAAQTVRPEASAQAPVQALAPVPLPSQLEAAREPVQESPPRRASRSRTESSREPEAAREAIPMPPPLAEREEADREAEPRRASPHLYVVEGGDDELDSGDTVPLSAAVTIGRSDENSLQLFDRFVSSRHALICLRDGHRLLLDRGSTNGTFVNGERVDKEIELKPGDRVAMGNTVFEYRTG